ncbi:hypothetical protein HCX48_03435 [Rhodocyclus tenuis]|uniref:Chalcone isomerase domain-containing protein n=3 Tax=Rhodocyclus TaxID=1064 RepID=A0A6L5JTL8_RHOTE|nr:hypothetical protein [Rhodocyclus gracilis]NJA88276.1 hypothetical protein [Rhodocyclus gracilis]
MMNRLRSLLAACSFGVLTLLTLPTAHAVEAGGINFDDRARVGNSDLVANGAGMRKKLFIKVYAMALYLPARQSDGDAVLASHGAKRITVQMLRDVTAQQFVDALNEGIAENHTPAELAALKDRARQFADAMLSVGEAKSGTVVQLDWLPESGTRLTINGQTRGRDIAGEDFYTALLKIWIGHKPIQDELKQALLGRTR